MPVVADGRPERVQNPVHARGLINIEPNTRTGLARISQRCSIDVRAEDTPCCRRVVHRTIRRAAPGLVAPRVADSVARFPVIEFRRGEHARAVARGIAVDITNPEKVRGDRVLAHVPRTLERHHRVRPLRLGHDCPRGHRRFVFVKRVARVVRNEQRRRITHIRLECLDGLLDIRQQAGRDRAFRVTAHRTVRHDNDREQDSDHADAHEHLDQREPATRAPGCSCVGAHPCRLSIMATRGRNIAITIPPITPPSTSTSRGSMSETSEPTATSTSSS